MKLILRYRYRMKRGLWLMRKLKVKLSDVFCNAYLLLAKQHRGATLKEKVSLLRAHLSYSLGFSTIHRVREVSVQIYDAILSRRLAKTYDL